MTQMVMLDSAPLGLITNPKRTHETILAKKWLDGLRMGGIQVVIPEIVDYELRRELLRSDKTNGLRNLDMLIEELTYLPLNTLVMRQAAVFWASLRQLGQPTADVAALDGDVILAAQAFQLSLQGHDVLVATSNVTHLSRLVSAQFWKTIIK